MNDRIHDELGLLSRYVGWTEEDAARLKSASEALLADVDDMVEDFYAEILRHPQTASVLAGGDRQVERLKGSLRAWLRELCHGPHDEAYVERRWRIGKRHVDIGVGPKYVIAAFARLRSRLIESLQRRWTGSLEEFSDVLASLNRRLDVDLGLIQDSYESASLARSEPIDAWGVRKHRVLAQIGERALAGLSLRDLFDQAALLAAESFGADRCEVWEWDEASRSATLRTGYGWPPEDVGRLRVAVEAGGEFDFVFDHRRAIAVGDWSRETRFRKTVDLAARPSASGIFMRISANERPFGVVAAHFVQARTFSHADYDFLQSVGNILSTAVLRQREDERRRDNEQRLRRLVEGLPAGALYLSNGRVVVNHAFESMTGYDRREVAALEDWERIVLWSAFDGSAPPSSAEAPDGAVVRRHVGVRRKDGQERMLLVSAYRGAADEVWLIHDVTEEDRRRERELQAERLAAIGQMITGLAHESRNALQRIRACTEMLEFDLESNPAAMELLGRIGKAQDDLQRLFDEVRSYASPMPLERRRVRLRSILEEAWDACRPLWVGRNAHLDVRSEGEACDELCVDRFRVAQLFRNIFENSLAACGDPVAIAARCRPTELGGAPAVEIHVEDNGPGLPEEVRERVFEPFFTTKSKGTGLGMAIAQRIVEMHGGGIALGDSERGGAAFVIRLPRGGE